MSEGRFDLALAQYQPVANVSEDAIPEHLQYRIALAYEGLGRLDEAVQRYRRLGSRSANPRTQAAVQAGTARVLLRSNRPAEASLLLSLLLLRSADPALRHQPYLAETRFMLGLAITRAASGGKATQVDEPFVASIGVNWPIERFVTWADPVRENKEAFSRQTGEFVRIRKSGELLEETVISASLPDVDLIATVDRVARECGLKTEWTARARANVQEQTRTVLIDELPLLDWLRAVSISSGLTAVVEKGTIRLASEDEIPSKELQRRQRESARRALREAVLAHPGHVLMPAAYLELGNLDAADGRFTEAAAWFERVVREAPRTPDGVAASYNLGLLHRWLGNRESARTAFFRAIDQNPTGRLAPAAYLGIAHLFFEDGSPEQAVSQLRRALDLAGNSETVSRIAVTLAAAHLLAGNSRQANEILLTYRNLISREPYRATAAFLDSLARYRLSGGNRRQQDRDSAELLAAVLATRNEPILGPAGQLLRGHALRDLGFRSEMVALYRQVLPQVRGALLEEMMYSVAESIQSDGDLPAARARYIQLVKQGRTRWADAARYRLAEIALAQQQPEESMVWLQPLLSHSAIDERQVLVLLGRVYEEMGQFDLAARCFAGQRPLDAKK